MDETRQHAVEPWAGETLRVDIPPGRDPFVNTPLLALGKDENGAERFWISTWNANVGSLAVLVTETGDERVYRFGDKRHGGFYSAVSEDKDTLWLCGDLSRVLRFSLSTGQFDEYPTGVPSALVFQGMALDPETGKLFALAHDMSRGIVNAFSFDTRRRETAKLHSGFADDKYMRFSFPNGDGTFSFVVHIPGESLLRWDPQAETIAAVRLSSTLDVHAQSGGTTYRLISDEHGRRYFPHRGWYDPSSQRFIKENPLPQKEMTWFRRVGGSVWGCDSESGNAKLGRWDMSTGEVNPLCTIPDCQIQNVNVTAAGKIIAVNKNGYFYRFDGQTGLLEMTRRLPTDSIGRVDCLCRIDNERLLGTPFITQRFWEANLRTGKGYDCGRAAPGGGEILKTWKLGGKVYMAAYTGGQLVEYDPAYHPHFPENPRIVAAPPHAMRPVAAADDGRHIYYACSTAYGTLGSTLTQYDTATGHCRYAVNPLPEQQIVSLWFDPSSNSLLGGTTMHADCRSCSPTATHCLFARFDAGSLAVIKQTPAPEGTTRAVIEGPLGGGQYLCQCIGPFGETESLCFTLDGTTFDIPKIETLCPLPPKSYGLTYAGIPGYFLLRQGTRIELWDMRKEAPARLLHDAFDGYAVKVQEASVYLLYPREIKVLEGCLSGLS